MSILLLLIQDNQSTTSVDIQQPLIYNAILPWNKVVHHETMSSLFAAVRCWIPSLVEGAVCDNDLQVSISHQLLLLVWECVLDFGRASYFGDLQTNQRRFDLHADAITMHFYNARNEILA